MKKRLGPSETIFPVPAALIVSGINEDANIITIASEIFNGSATTARHLQF
jgi:hypothetical protein